MPYKGVQVLVTTWTKCLVCGAVVAHLDQRLHDRWHEVREGEPPVLEEAS